MPSFPPPKYPIEFYLEFQSNDRFVYRVSDLEELEKQHRQEVIRRLDQCHIYLLCKRPRVWIVSDSVVMDGSVVKFEVAFRQVGVERRFQTSLDQEFVGFPGTCLDVSPYPHRSIIARDSDGVQVGETLLANFVHIMPGLPSEVRDLEVVYVGKGLRRSAQDRLRHHETLQRLLSDVSASEPDKEIFALVHSFEMRKPMMALANAQAIITGDVAAVRYQKVLAYRPPLAHQVALIEASCISYFQTGAYNSHYIRFPEGSYQFLNPVRDADFAALVVQLDNTNIGGQRVYSSTVPPAAIHYIVNDFRIPDGHLSFLTSVSE